MSWSAKPGVWTPGATPIDAWLPADLGSTPMPSPETAVAAVDPATEAYAIGFAEGRAEGERAEQARLRTAVRAVEEASEAIASSDARWTGAAEENVITIAVAIARHIIDRELSVDPSIVGKLVKRALAEFPIDQPLRIRVNPDDLAVMESLDEHGTRDALGNEHTAQWVGDPRITGGGCVVEGRERIVDGRIEQALERIYRRLTHAHA